MYAIRSYYGQPPAARHRPTAQATIITFYAKQYFSGPLQVPIFSGQPVWQDRLFFLARPGPLDNQRSNQVKTLLITGTNGTLAPVVARLFNEYDWHTVAWDRTRVDPEDTAACQIFWREVKPDAVCHLALGSEAWATWLAVV